MVQIESICWRQNKCDPIIEICLGKVENIVGIGENAGDQHFLLLPRCFQKGYYSMSFKVRIMW